MSEASVIPIEAIHPDLSEFGRTIYKIMIAKGIKSFTALAGAMDSNEYRVYRQTITKYVKGEQSVQPRFVRRFVEVLKLTKAEERELAWMLYQYG